MAGRRKETRRDRCSSDSYTSPGTHDQRRGSGMATLRAMAEDCGDFVVARAWRDWLHSCENILRHFLMAICYLRVRNWEMREGGEVKE